ncbi:hypothetical protein PHMEG_0003232 [Phytophthora megakarya]|uniref:Uncharacterized protein n=1 Tax=Phytophthora megakarya TaxID=4795 RepID=A0A225WWP9_9STRA|nr:hypothetical protein PHMEG_0003232 [Phytophthora megakarya]
MDISCVKKLAVSVKGTRNRINRQSRENLKGVPMIPNQPLGKRKWEENPKKKGAECSYCEGRYNRDGETHRKDDCPKMKKDRSIGLVRTSIFVKGKGVKVPPKSVGVSHVKGEKKGSKKKDKPMREEIPADVALMQPISKVEVAAVVKSTPQEPESGYGAKLTSEQAQQDADELMMSPLYSPTPSLPSSAMSDDENDMDECMQYYFPSHSVKLSEGPSKIKATDGHREHDPGCGYGLTADVTLFVRKQASEEFRFTFGEGTKLSNTHVGTVKLYFHGPDGI